MIDQRIQSAAESEPQVQALRPSLGVVTAATCKLFPQPRTVVTAWLAVPSVSAAIAVYAAARDQLGDELTAFEFANRLTVDFVQKHIAGSRSPLEAASPWYLLVDSGGNQPLEGQFSIAMKNGNSGQDLQSPWISSYLSQTALMPVGTHSLTLLATGNLAIYWNGAPLSVVALGGNFYGADVSALAGTVGELRFTNLGLTHGELLTIDDIRFRNTVVPEPASITLLAIAITATVLARKSKRQA